MPTGTHMWLKRKPTAGRQDAAPTGLMLRVSYSTIDFVPRLRPMGSKNRVHAMGAAAAAASDRRLPLPHQLPCTAL